MFFSDVIDGPYGHTVLANEPRFAAIEYSQRMSANNVPCGIVFEDNDLVVVAGEVVAPLHFMRNL